MSVVFTAEGAEIAELEGGPKMIGSGKENEKGLYRVLAKLLFQHFKVSQFQHNGRNPKREIQHQTDDQHPHEHPHSNASLKCTFPLTHWASVVTAITPPVSVKGVGGLSQKSGWAGIPVCFG